MSVRGMKMKDKLLKYSMWLWRFSPVFWILFSLFVFCMIFGFTTLSVIFTAICAIAITILFAPFVTEAVQRWYRRLGDWWEDRPWLKK